MNKEEIRQLPRDERVDFLRRQYFTGVIRTFVEEYPSPNKDEFSLGGGVHSFRDVLHAVEDGTDVGKRLTKYIFEASKQYGEPVSSLVNGKSNSQNNDSR